MPKTVYQTIQDFRTSHARAVLDNECTILTWHGRPIALITRLNGQMDGLSQMVIDGTLEERTEMTPVNFQTLYRQFKSVCEDMEDRGFSRAIIVRSNYNGPGYGSGYPVAKATLTLLSEKDRDALDEEIREASSFAVDEIMGWV